MHEQNLWLEIVNQEADYLDRVATELESLSKAAESSAPLEQIYAAAYHAYTLAHAELARLEQDLASMSQTASTLNAGWIPPALKQTLAQMPQARQQVVREMLTTFRLCMNRPSDVMRLEMRRQAGAILNGLQQLAMQSALSDEALAHDIAVIGNLLCRFDSLTPQTPSTPTAPWYSSFLTIPGLLVAAGVGALAWFGRGYAEDAGWIGGGESEGEEEPLALQAAPSEESAGV